VTTTKTFAQAFLTLQAAIRPAIKDATNPAFRSKYADLGAVWEAIKTPLQDAGFVVIQAPDFDAETMWLTTTIMHTSGESISGRYPIRPVKQDPQGYGSALTYARRYSLSAMLGVIADDDDDGNAASNRGGNGNGDTHKRNDPTPPPPPPAPDPKPHMTPAQWAEKAGQEINDLRSKAELTLWLQKNAKAVDALLDKDKACYNAINIKIMNRSDELGRNANG